MNIFNRVTAKTLVKNRTRTAVTIIGIMLSTALICAITTSISSLRNFGLENMIYQCGDWHGAVYGADGDTVDALSSNADVKSAFTLQNIGYAALSDSINAYKPYLFIAGCDETFMKSMPIRLTSGRLPQNSGELLLPEHLAANGGVYHSLGDKLTLQLGQRENADGTLWQHTSYQSADDGAAQETLNPTQTRSYTVVGFYSRPDFEPYSAPGYTAVTLQDADVTGYSRDVYLKMNNPKDTYPLLRSTGLVWDDNGDVLMLEGVSMYVNFYAVLYSIAAIVIVLVVVSSISLIYNAFSISVSERTKQFGLLSSVGATKKQLRRSVYFEALTVSAIGIPLGILLGIGGIGVTLTLLSDKFTSLGDFALPMRLSVSFAAVAVAVAVALVTVLLSAGVPSRRATKITAIEAIRQSSDVKVSNREVKTSKLTYALFGLPGMLASKNYKRSRRRYRATVLSLFMSIVLFVSASALSQYLTESVSGSFATSGYDLLYIANVDYDTISPENVLSVIKQEPHVTAAAYSTFFSRLTRIDNEYLASPDAESDSLDYSVALCFAQDEEYAKYLQSLGVDSASWLSRELPPAVALEGYADFNYSEGKFTSDNVLKSDNCRLTLYNQKQIAGYYLSGHSEDETGAVIYTYEPYDSADPVITLPAAQAVSEVEITTGKLTTQTPYFLTRVTTLTLIYPYSAIEAVLGGNFANDETVYYTITSSDHAASYTGVAQLLQANGFGSSALDDYAASTENMRNIVTIMNVFSYGFIVLISLIAAANVFNTISTNIALRRREFAMLKSVGMSAGGFNAMMNYECLLYGSRALITGLPVSAAVTFLIYLSINRGYQIAYRLPWAAMAIAAASVFAVVLATMMYSMRKIKRDNPIDALKNENM